MKPSRRWLAFLLNLVFPPTGYVYVGALRAAVLFVAALAAVILLLSVWTIYSPPGIYVLPWLSPRTPGTSLYTAALALVVAVHASLLAGKSVSRPTGVRLWVMGAGGYLLILVAAGLIRAFSPVSVYTLASSSNEPGLADGDIVAVHGARAVCGRARPAAGDLIVYRRPRDPAARLTHRVVAVGGDEIEVRDGRLIVNGEAAELTPTGRTFAASWGRRGAVLRETLSNGTEHEVADLIADSESDTFAPRVVPDGHVFVMGDNRDNALDSRFEGPVPLRDVCGVAFKVLQAKDAAHIGRRP